MEIRALGQEDLPQLADLFDRYRVFYRQPTDRAAASAFVSQRLSRGDSAFLGAIVNDVLVGFVQMYPSYTSVGLGRLWILNDLYVSADARKRGVASALMNAAREYAEMTGARGMTLGTAKDNHAAQHLYEKLGWVRDQEFFQYELNLSPN